MIRAAKRGGPTVWDEHPGTQLVLKAADPGNIEDLPSWWSVKRGICLLFFVFFFVRVMGKPQRSEMTRVPINEILALARESLLATLSVTSKCLYLL
jgi:hypothetical protein